MHAVYSPGQLTATQHWKAFPALGTGAAFMWPCERIWTSGSCDEGLVPQTQFLRNRKPLVSSYEPVEGAQLLSFSKTLLREEGPPGDDRNVAAKRDIQG